MQRKLNMYLKEDGNKMKDFTITMYKKLMNTISNSSYKVITFNEYFNNPNQYSSYIIVRHDVDKWPKNAQKLAEIEAKNSLKTTYYFRTIRKVFKPNIIKTIFSFKHEIGYHYETLAHSNGNYKKAHEMFINNLKRMREISPVKTICMHGSSFSKFDNRWLWNKFDYKKEGIIGEPYLDIDYSDILYLSDSGGSWSDYGQRSRDIISQAVIFQINDTNELIQIIEKKEFQKIILLMHPDRWNSGIKWYYELISKRVRNNIKKVFNLIRTK